MRATKSIRFVVSLALALVLSVNAAAQQPAAAPQRGASVEGMTEYQLPNGLRVLLFPDAAKPTITVNVTYLVGSRNENYGETGMAHLLEHMLFKGTPKYTNIPQLLNERGARFNGSTWLDRTNYTETFPASDEVLQWFLEFESDRMVNSYVAKKDLDSEMTVVRNEFEAGENSPGNVLLQRTLSAAFIWHNYGNPTIGAKADLEKMPIERLQAFYKTYYQPDNAVLVVAGKFDEAKTLATISKFFGGIPRPTRVLPLTYTAEPTQDGEREVTLRRVGDVQALCVVYKVPSSVHADDAAVSLLSSILGDVPTGRLHKALVETQKATSAYGFKFSTREPGILIFGAELRKDQSMAEAREILLKTVEGVLNTPITQQEVDRAKAASLNGLDVAFNTPDRIGIMMSEYIALGDWRLAYLSRDRLKAATVDDVRRVAAAYLKPANRTSGVFVPTEKPERADIPESPDVAALVKDYKGQAVAQAGEVFDPSPSNIESRVHRTTLPGGLKVAMLPKDNRGDAVSINITLRFGNLARLTGRDTAASFAGSMLMRGTKKHTREQITTELDRLQARGGVSGGTTQAGASFETKRESVPELLRLIAEILREPSFPAEEFEQLKQQQLAGIEEGRSEPQQVAGTAIQRHLSPYKKGDPRYVTSVEEDIADVNAATLDQAKAFYNEFYGASYGEIAIVGDFDEQATTRLLGELLGDWKTPGAYARLEGLYKDAPPINQAFETPDKANAVFIAALNLPLRDDDPDYPALILGNYMLGGGALNSRLASRIRGKEGLSYGVGSSLSASALDKVGSFNAFAIYAPQNAAKLEAAFREEIDLMLKSGFTAEEVAAAKAGYLQSRHVSRSQDGSLARGLSSYLFIDRTYVWDRDFESKINALTPEQIIAAMRRHLDPTKISIVRAGDFAKK